MPSRQSPFTNTPSRAAIVPNVPGVTWRHIYKAGYGTLSTLTLSTGVVTSLTPGVGENQLWTLAGATQLLGMDAGQDGEIRVARLLGRGVLTIVPNHTNATAGEAFRAGPVLSAAPGQTVTFIYDATAGFWDVSVK